MGVSRLILSAAEVWPLGHAAAAVFRAIRGDRAIDNWVFRRIVERWHIEVPARFEIAPSLTLECDAFGYLASCLRRDGTYEPTTTRAWLALLERGAVVIDVGANAGYFTLLAAARTTPGSVHAFEPHPVTAAYLRRNAARNRLTVHIAEAALSDAAGEVSLFLGETPDTHSIGRTQHSREGEVRVQARTLDDYVTAHTLDRVDLIKVDVEGAERLVVRGATETLRRFAPVLLLELGAHSAGFGYSPADLVAELGNRGYRPFALTSWPLTEWRADAGDESAYNVLFVPAAAVDAGSIRGAVPIAAAS